MPTDSIKSHAYYIDFFRILNLRLFQKGYEVFMAKAGMRRPDPSDPHGTESNHKTNYKKMIIRKFPQRYKGKLKQDIQKHHLYSKNQTKT